MEELSFFLDINGSLFQIAEPEGFDAAAFVIEQDKDRYGRDISYMSEKTNLTFYKDTYQYDHNTDTFLNHSFDYLLDAYRNTGFESKINLIVKRNNIDFVTGELDFAMLVTDESTYFTFSVIIETAKAKLKRVADIPVNLFSDKSFDNTDIQPLQPTKIFLKAKPVVQVSEWGSKSRNLLEIVDNVQKLETFYVLSQNLTRFNIENSYAPFDDYFFLTENSTQNDYDTAIDDNKLIKALNDLSNIKVVVKNLNINITMSGSTSFDIHIILGSGQSYSLLNFTTPPNTQQTFTYSGTLETTIPFVASSDTIGVYAHFFVETIGGFGQKLQRINNISCDGIEIIATSTAISSVIKGVRFIDMIKQNALSTSNMTVDAEDYDVNGEHYNNFVFNGKLIRQFENEPFYIKFNDIKKQLKEINYDFQINNDNIYIGHFEDFYSNNEIGAYLGHPNAKEFDVKFNDDFKLNAIDYKYKSFEQDRDEAGTTDAVHTSTTWLIQNKSVENKLNIEIPFVRDPFEIESNRRQSFYTKDTTSLDNDDKVYIIDCVQIAPNTRENFTRVLDWQSIISTNQVKLLSDGTFNWGLLGFSLGNTITININNEGNVNYTVQTITASLLTLQPVGSSIQFDENGTDSIFIDYPLTGVTYKIRTNEEFQTIENVYNGENFGNLQYTIRRNLKYWESYIRTACSFITENISNKYFKSNGNLITEFRNGGLIKENADIIINEMPNAILSPRVYETLLIASYEDVLNTIDKMKTKNIDGSIGGFIRCKAHDGRVLKLYPRKLSYTWLTGELLITGEEKAEKDQVSINTIGSNLIEINETGYDSNIIRPLDIYAEGDSLQIKDHLGIPLTNLLKYDKYFVNGNNFTNLAELVEVILQL